MVHIVRQVGRGVAERRHMRRLSCPNFRGQDILQAHLITGKEDNLCNSDRLWLTNRHISAVSRSTVGQLKADTSPTVGR